MSATSWRPACGALPPWASAPPLHGCPKPDPHRARGCICCLAMGFSLFATATTLRLGLRGEYTSLKKPLTPPEPPRTSPHQMPTPCPGATLPTMHKSSKEQPLRERGNWTSQEGSTPANRCGFGGFSFQGPRENETDKAKRRWYLRIVLVILAIGGACVMSWWHSPQKRETRGVVASEDRDPDIVGLVYVWYGVARADS